MEFLRVDLILLCIHPIFFLKFIWHGIKDEEISLKKSQERFYISAGHAKLTWSDTNMWRSHMSPHRPT